MRSELPQAIKDALARAPDAPGVYRMWGAGDEPLYVGKASSLRTRMRSYFQQAANHPPRIAALVAEVRRLDFIVTRSEVEALILEANLIKEHHPPGNILLRDDKDFPYLKLTIKDAFPRVTLVRRPKPDGNLHFGPFLPASHAHRMLRLIPRFFQVANCQLRFDGKQRPCLHHHLDQCLAPCAGRADAAEYAERVREARLFLSGRNRELAEAVGARMRAASAAQEFERAARYRDLLGALAALSQKQSVISLKVREADFWAEHREGDQVAIELFRMREGRVIGRREFTLDPAPPAEQLYDVVLPQYYADEPPPAEVVLCRGPADGALLEEYLHCRGGRKVRLEAPVHGARRRLLDMVAQNARLAFEARFRATHAPGVAALDGLRDALGLDEAPFRIEALDVSHLQGADARAALIVFEGGRPKKSDYRTFKLRTAAPGDDYQALREVVVRRYGRLKREGRRLPGLVLVDGGRGQLGAAVAALSEVGLPTLPVAALAKREEQVFLEGRDGPIILERRTAALRLLQQVRDEAHRCAVQHHRRARSSRTLRSALTAARGVGPVTARRLLDQFGSLAGVRAAADQALAAAVGPARARLVRAALGPPPASQT